MFFLDILSAILLGVIEGLTEFIPVSSTGHLILVSDLIGFSENKTNTFEIFIQLGAILAVVTLYSKKFLNLFDFKNKNSFSGATGLKKIFLATLPALFFGFLLYDFIKENLFSNLTVALALIFGGIVLIFIEKLIKESPKKEFEQISYTDCFVVGMFQCLAMWPGMSRSGSTIVGGIIRGFDKKLSAEFSFFMAVPVMCAAVTYDMYKNIQFLTFSDIPIFLVGFIVSYLVAVLAIKFFLRILNKYSLAPFGIYRIILGIIVFLTVLR